MVQSAALNQDRKLEKEEVNTLIRKKKNLTPPHFSLQMSLFLRIVEESHHIVEMHFLIQSKFDLKMEQATTNGYFHYWMIPQFLTLSILVRKM